MDGSSALFWPPEGMSYKIVSVSVTAFSLFPILYMKLGDHKRKNVLSRFFGKIPVVEILGLLGQKCPNGKTGKPKQTVSDGM